MLTPIAIEEERLRIIHECRQSGLTANEWCRQHGLRWNTYHTWVTRLKKERFAGDSSNGSDGHDT